MGNLGLTFSISRHRNAFAMDLRYTQREREHLSPLSVVHVPSKSVRGCEKLEVL